MILFLVGIKLLPRTFSIVHSRVSILCIVDCLLLMSFMIKRKGSVQIGENQKIYVIFLMVLAPAICFFNTEHVMDNPIIDMLFLMVVLSYAIYGFVFFLLYAITNRVKVTIVSGMILFTIYALANSFIKEFRGIGIRTADIFAIQTAANVARGYRLVFNQEKVEIILLAFTVILLSLHCQYRNKKVKYRMTLVAGFFCYLLILHSIFWNKEFMKEKWVEPWIWEMEKGANYHGRFLDFVAGIPYLSVDKPEGYSAEEAEKLLSNSEEETTDNIHNNLQGKKPDIVVIMNESFADLGVLGELETDEQYLGEFYSIKENVIRGNLSVPVFGGLTANTEFEFITGFSNAFLPSGVIAYQNYVKNDTPNLNTILEEQGYHSIFMHPMSGNGWNRKNVYQSFGFDETYYIEDFQNADMLREKVSDRSNYKEVIQKYEKAKKENENVFLFDVTMQNHGGYSTDGFEKTVRITNLDGNYPDVEEYLSLIKESDAALKELVDYFSEKENPVLLCVFGDHLPALDNQFYEELQQCKNEDSDLMKQAKRYQTPFMLYANYEMDEKIYENIGANYLQVLLMDAADLPFSEYQKYLSSMMKEHPVVNINGVKNKDNNWYSWNETQEFSKIKEYSWVQYKNLFDD